MPAVAALALVWLATIALVVIKQFAAFDPITLIYILPVVVAATQWGIVAAIIAAIAGAAAADFFFFPPLYSFWIRDPQNVVDLILFLVVAVVTGDLAARLKKEALSLSRRCKTIFPTRCAIAPRSLQSRPVIRIPHTVRSSRRTFAVGL